jgi:hypothetical protein
MKVCCLSYVFHYVISAYFEYTERRKFSRSDECKEFSFMEFALQDTEVHPEWL